MIVRYVYHKHINKETLELISKVYELFLKTPQLNKPVLLVKIPNLYKYSFDSTFYVLNLLIIHLKRHLKMAKRKLLLNKYATLTNCISYH